MSKKKPPIVTRESLRDMLASASAERQQHIVGRALVAIFRRQTQSEQAGDETNRHNGVGFAHCDAYGGSMTAKSYLKHGALMSWQVESWTKVIHTGFPRICKYASQLNEVAYERSPEGRPSSPPPEPKQLDL